MRAVSVARQSSLADVATWLSTSDHGVWLFLRMARFWLMVNDQSLSADGAPLVFAATINRFLWLLHEFADGGYAGEKLEAALAKIGSWTREIIKRSDTAKCFALLPAHLGCRTHLGRAQSQTSLRQWLRTIYRKLTSSRFFSPFSMRVFRQCSPDFEGTCLEEESIY
jgi:hypothetical protein